ncbi:hypothetical protein NDU88_011546 [Pleurodeles waltl]|uniref:Uncharacterized protein n=1 Tax=Pleurodeles waltl TaxID=8319 RepID=A0AAV7R1B4_PLEWA|nr:hypothetical protein NDU88_011546 [Pleurodeles waltl]
MERLCASRQRFTVTSPWVCISRSEHAAVLLSALRARLAVGVLATGAFAHKVRNVGLGCASARLTQALAGQSGSALNSANRCPVGSFSDVFRVA